MLKKWPRNKIVEAVKETLEGSSVHAIPNIARSRDWILSLIWSVFLLISVSACAWYLYDSISSYYERQVITNVKVNYAFTLPFPIVTICDKNRKGISFKDFMYAEFLHKTLVEYDFESFSYPSLGPCLRFNSGKSNNGSLIPLKHVYDVGYNGLLSLTIQSNIRPLIWFSNESITEGVGSSFSPGFMYDLKLHRSTITKQPEPYSKCIVDLYQETAYDSELFKKTLRLKNGTGRYYYSDCIKLCKQKNVGEKCNEQSSWLGPAYFDGMKYDDSEITLSESDCKTTNQYPSMDYLTKCDCPVECDKIRYSFDYSFIKWTTNKNDTVFSIFYDQLEETVIREEPKMQLSDFISTVGGILIIMMV